MTMIGSVDEIIREYIDFVNRQVGVYMDALAGFEGHYTRVERQVHRVSRPKSSSIDEKGQQVVVWASYEDPTQPDIIHNRIIKATDYIEANARDGSNSQQHSQAIMVFLYSYWEEEIRPRLAVALGIEKNSIRSNIMGDLRILRNVILHAKGVLSKEKHDELNILKGMFHEDKGIIIPYENMHKIFVLIKQDCARIMFEWLGVKDAPIRTEDLKDIAIQLASKKTIDPKN